jgi:hypothetical protein
MSGPIDPISGPPALKAEAIDLMKLPIRRATCRPIAAKFRTPRGRDCAGPAFGQDNRRHGQDRAAAPASRRGARPDANCRRRRNADRPQRGPTQSQTAQFQMGRRFRSR